MPKLIDLTGQRFARLTVLRRDTSRNGVYWLCKCDCGKLISVRPSALKSGNTKSCGCYNLDNIHKKQRNAIDITNNRFGNLVALEYVKSDNRGTIWRCQCDCGKIKDIPLVQLTGGNTKSCGCLEQKNREANLKNFMKLNTVDDTNIALIKKTDANKNSSTGVRGVWYNSKKRVYVVSITFKKIHHTIGRFKTLKEATTARKDAEDKYFKPYLDGIDT